MQLERHPEAWPMLIILEIELSVHTQLEIGRLVGAFGYLRINESRTIRRIDASDLVNRPGKAELFGVQRHFADEGEIRMPCSEAPETFEVRQHIFFVNAVFVERPFDVIVDGLVDEGAPVAVELIDALVAARDPDGTKDLRNAGFLFSIPVVFMERRIERQHIRPV